MVTRNLARLAMASLWLLAGCATHRYVSPYEAEKIERADKIIVTTAPDSPSCCRHELKDARLEGQNLIGRTMYGDKMTIALSSIESVMIISHSFPTWHLAAAAVALGAVAGAVAIGAELREEEQKAPPPPGGSCPYFYSFDGKRYVFDAEPYGGAISQGLERTEWCRLEHMREKGGVYKLRVVNELNETQYADEIKLVVVDHPWAVAVAPNIRGRIHTLSDPMAPTRATDEAGADVLPALVEKDGVFWESAPRKRDPDREQDLMDELVLEFPRPEGAKKVKLLVHGSTTRWGTQVAWEFLKIYGAQLPDWYAEVDRRGPALRKILDWYFREELYVLQVHVHTGEGWQSRGTIFGGGPYAPKDKVYVLRLGDVPGDTLRIKLRPPAYFWRFDYIAVDYTEDLPVRVTEIAPFRAVDHEGRDVLSLVSGNDDSYLVLPEIGDSAELVFEAPPRIPDTSRAVLLKATGYYRLHLDPEGEPMVDLIERINDEPGFTARYALEQYNRRNPWRGP